MTKEAERKAKRAANVIRKSKKSNIDDKSIDLVQDQLPVLTAEMMRQTNKLIESFRKLVEEEDENEDFLSDPISYINESLAPSLLADEIAPGVSITSDGLIEAYRKARELNRAGELNWNEVAGVHSRAERKTFANIIEKRSALIDTKRERAVHTERNRHTVTSTSDRFLGVSTPLIDPSILISIDRWQGDDS